MTWIAGIDGCPAGWIGVLRRLGEPAAARVLVAPRFVDILEAPERPAILAVDMPIGLPARIGAGGRGPEALVRPLLGGRQSSVFAVPSRAAVWAADYGEACRLAQATSDPPRKVSKQCFHLFPRIREIDALLREGPPDLRDRVFEVHPEVAFWRLAGERALAEPKKVKSRPHEPGLAERRAILLAAGLPEALVGMRPPRGAGADDLLDALVTSVIAERLHAGRATPFPNPPGRDEHGLPVAIWA